MPLFISCRLRLFVFIVVNMICINLSNLCSEKVSYGDFHEFAEVSEWKPRGWRRPSHNKVQWFLLDFFPPDEELKLIDCGCSWFRFCSQNMKCETRVPNGFWLWFVFIVEFRWGYSKYEMMQEREQILLYISLKCFTHFYMSTFDRQSNNLCI